METQSAGEAVFRHIARIVDQTENIVSIAELNELFRGALLLLGYQLFAYIRVIEKDSCRDIEALFGEGYAAWSSHYRQMRFADDDPVIREAEARCVPFYWTELANRRQISSRALRVMEFAKRLELHEGFVSPQRNMDGCVTFVLFAGTGMNPTDAHDRIATEILANHYGRYGKRLLPACLGKRYKGLLTPRQIECLKWACMGKSSKDTAAILGVSPCVVDEHLGKACNRLKVRTRGQAIYEAGRRGLDVRDP